MAAIKTLSVAQLLVLTTAAQRLDRMVLPLPATLRARGAIRQRLLTTLLRAALLEEVPAPDNTVSWREDASGRPLALSVTAAGLAAVGTPASSPQPKPDRDALPALTSNEGQAVAVEPATGTPAAEATAATGGQQEAPTAAARPGGKLGQVLAAVTAEAGASLIELVALTGWQPHTARAALTGLRRRGYAVHLAERDGRKAYRLRQTVQA